MIFEEALHLKYYAPLNDLCLSKTMSSLDWFLNVDSLLVDDLELTDLINVDSLLVDGPELSDLIDPADCIERAGSKVGTDSSKSVLIFSNGVYHRR